MNDGARVSDYYGFDFSFRESRPVVCSKFYISLSFFNLNHVSFPLLYVEFRAEECLLQEMFS